MKMVAVESSNLALIGYDPETRELHVSFHCGMTHAHADVPPEKHSALMGADSHGKYYNQHIRPHHASKRVDAAAALRDKPDPEPAPQQGEVPDSLEDAVARFREE